VIKKNSKVKRVAATLAIGIGGILLLSSCALPNQERYQLIDETKENLDYKNTGKVKKERYDNGDGVSSPSFFLAEIEGLNTFETLTAKVKALPNVNCSTLAEEQTRCKVGQLDVYITQLSPENNIIQLQILDRYSGRAAK
jgi:hypothetical protein